MRVLLREVFVDVMMVLRIDLLDGKERASIVDGMMPVGKDLDLEVDLEGDVLPSRTNVLANQ